MPHDVIAICPVCDHELEVTRLHCPDCDTTLDGHFRVGRFGRLTRDQLALLESFLRARGNLRDMERELGISYPTVRNRLEALVRALGLAGESVEAPGGHGVPGAASASDARGTGRITDATAGARRRILERLAAHEIDATAAASAIRALERDGSADA
jgi:hypothetical protein